jgi:type I restriction enzyme M protein
VGLQKTKAESDNSWNVNIADVDQATFDLSVRNPNKNDEVILRDPHDILDEIKQLDEESASVLNAIRRML